MESTKNCTTLRLLNYPNINEDSDIKPGQIRCGEHTDYGSITLLFQDDMPGLEVLVKWKPLFQLLKQQTERWLKSLLKCIYCNAGFEPFVGESAGCDCLFCFRCTSTPW